MHWPRLALVLGLVLMVAAAFAGPTAGNAVADMDEGHAIAVFHVGDSMTEQAQTLIAYGELVLFDSQPRAVAVAPELEANNQGVVAIIPAPAWREFVAMIASAETTGYHLRL